MTPANVLPPAFQDRFIIARKEVAARLYFHRHMSVILFTGEEGVCLWCQRGVSATHTHPSADTPPGRPPWADTPMSCACWDTHPPAQCMLGYTPNPVHAGIHTPRCIVHAEIWSTSGRYASHWNAFLLSCILPLNSFCHG